MRPTLGWSREVLPSSIAIRRQLAQQRFNRRAQVRQFFNCTPDDLHDDGFVIVRQEVSKAFDLFPSDLWLLAEQAVR